MHLTPAHVRHFLWVAVGGWGRIAGEACDAAGEEVEAGGATVFVTRAHE